MSTPLERLDPRVRRTRQALHDAFGALFQETHDFEHMTVQDIAERAGVNRATFYAHFVDKYALLDDFISQAFDQRLAATLPAGHTGAVGLHRLVSVTGEFLYDMLTACGPHNQGQHGALIMRQIQACVKAVVHKDLSLQQTPADLEVTFMSWAVFGAAFDWSQGPRRRPAQALADDVVAFIERGIPSGQVACVSGAPTAFAG